METKVKIKWIFLSIIAVLIVGFLHYNLMRTDVVYITGTDTKRVDNNKKDISKTEGTKKSTGTIRVTHDVRYINAITRKGKVKVYRNERTGWGWPPYFKFDSADITAEAQSAVNKDPKPWVLIKYYGWRIHILSMYPNIINIKFVDKDYNHFPLFNIIVLGLIFGGIYYFVKKLKGFKTSAKRRFSKKSNQTAE